MSECNCNCCCSSRPDVTSVVSAAKSEIDRLESELEAAKADLKAYKNQHDCLADLLIEAKREISNLQQPPSDIEREAVVMPEKMPDVVFKAVREIWHNYGGDYPEIDMYKHIRQAPSSKESDNG